MSALTNDRQTPEMEGNSPKGFASGTPGLFNCYFGQMLVQDKDGILHAAAHSTTMSGSVVVGVSQHTNFNITSATPLPEGQLTYKMGTFGFDNDGSNPVTSGTLPGTLLYATDDHTVGLSQGSGLNAVAGRLVDYQGGQVFVAIGPTTSISGSTF